MKRVLFFLLMIFVSFGVIADCENIYIYFMNICFDWYNDV